MATPLFLIRRIYRGSRDWLLVAALTAGVVGLVGPVAVSSQPQSDRALLKVHFIDVGTGDCIWIQTGDDGIAGNGRLDGLNIVVDGGDWGKFGRVNGYDAVSEYLGQSGRLPFGATIDWLIMTHPHSDHNGGLPGFLRDYNVRNILDPGHDKTNDDGEPDRERSASAYGKFFQAASAERGPDGQKANFVWGLPSNFTLAWGAELSAKVLWSSRDIVDGDLNNTSIVLRLGFSEAGRDVSFLFMGDAEQYVEQTLVTNLGAQLKTTVLKAGHHGSNSSTTEAFLEQVRPAHVVVSAGNQAFNGTVLPRPETFDRIAKVSKALGLNTQVWRTDRGDKTPVLKPVGTETGDDTVLASTDGRTLRIAYVDADAAHPSESQRCRATTKSGGQCKRLAEPGKQFCWQHGGSD